MVDPDAKVGLFTRIWDWLTYRPWTDDEIAEQVAKSVANTCYKKWHDRNMYVEIPMVGFQPGEHDDPRMTYAEFREQDRK